MSGKTANAGAARAATLGAIRSALHRDGPLPPELARPLAARLDGAREHAPHPRPRCDGDLVQRLTDKLRAVDGTVEAAADGAAVAASIEGYFERHGLARRLVIAPHPDLDRYPWPGDWRISRRAAAPDDAIAITPGFAGIAETGTIALVSGPQTPATLNFLPATHVVVLDASRIRPHLEDAWTMLRALPAAPRALFFVTGPSRTADIEQTLQVGAHGPTRFHLVIHHGG